MLNRLATVLLLGIVVPSACTAQADPRTGNCPADRVRADLGIDGVECDGCRIRGRRDPDRPLITFAEPPRIHGVVRGSVGDGVLQAGDLLLAVDGIDIVGRAGGFAYERMRPFVPVRLTIERDGRRRDVTLVPRLRCHPEHRGHDEVGDEDEDAVEDRADDRDRRRTARQRDEVALSRDPATCPAARRRVSMGIGMTCDGCQIRSRRDPTAPSITFAETPLIDEVHRGGAAEGLIQEGDVLLAIDGVPIVGRAGGHAFDAIRAGVPVRLTVQRNGQRRDVTLVPRLRCHVPDDDDDDEDDDEDP